jgi:DNA-binding MarR family transcriptional regulator
MSTLKFYLGLIKLIDSTSKELGLDSLTDSDRQVLNMLWEVADQNSAKASLSYEVFLDSAIAKGIKVSRSQFFKSLKKLEDVELIKRVEGPRSSTYQLKAE